MNNISHVSDESIQLAAELLKNSEVVAIPTETVYGLGANGFDDAAIRKIFELKKRPANNPLIFHVADTNEAKKLVSHWPDSATVLTEKFWPGPLTIVLPVREDFSSIALAGGRTIALRCPDHPGLLQLLRAVDFPIPAPSANLSESLSPVSAAHVFENFGEKIPLILDGGDCFVGLESTVVSLVEKDPVILRPGFFTNEDIQTVLNQKTSEDHHAESDSVIRQSPGQLKRHYAPNVETILFQNKREIVNQSNAFIITFEKSEISNRDHMICLDSDGKNASTQLYKAFWKAQSSNAKKIFVQVPPKGNAWIAIRDRLMRAVSNPELLD